ncbi:hypothetical protein [Pseudomonas aeruginosa]|uniref:hypothetical protein n=1 Tax=Pseudomonas aeruginosa TaxID=287 RepID=UPI0015E3FB05|nr:hypothetical protein [Pseudomonas aeruginosa]MBA1286452.1 hypothetical protein [Pseudomonas aeruginosa]
MDSFNVIDPTVMTTRYKISNLSGEAKNKLSLMAFFPGARWEDKEWCYLGLRDIRFLDDGVESFELEEVNKIYLVDYLWKRKKRSRPITPSHVADLSFSIRLFSRSGLNSIAKLNQDFYDSLVNSFEGKGNNGNARTRRINALVQYLDEMNLLSSSIVLAKPDKLYSTLDDFGSPAIIEKLPLPSLVRSIIELKSAVEDSDDKSTRAEMDKLSVYTQAFQYSMGLRIGEVLRLPADCLVNIEGQMYCRVWTEKGSEPIARYVPTVWRPMLVDVVEKINAICKPYRVAAKAIEEGTILDEIDARLRSRALSIEIELKKALDSLDLYILRNIEYANEKLELLRAISDDELFEIRELYRILPFGDRVFTDQSLVRVSKKLGLDLIRGDGCPKKGRYYVSGASIKRQVKVLRDFCGGIISFDDFSVVLFGRKFSNRNAYPSFFEDLKKSKRLSYFEQLAIFGVLSPKLSSTGLSFSYFDKEDAKKIITTVIGGGYDFYNELPLREAEELFPEFLGQNVVMRARRKDKVETGIVPGLELSNGEQMFYRRSYHKGMLRGVGHRGYLLKIRSLRASIINEFNRANSEVVLDNPLDDDGSPVVASICISSKSFNIRQKVSDYLFVVPSSVGAGYNESIPRVLGYYAVMYSLKPSGPGHSSAFKRYGVSVDKEVLDTFQTHKGRHWQTHSLFRAGLAASIINKWMGRTEVQGAHYDHRTARERASLVGELMLSEQSRFIGDLPEKIRSWVADELPDDDRKAYLNATLQTLHHSPLGYCYRNLNLRPCDFHLKCLTGNNGKGCREFIFDLHDPVQRSKIETERDRAELELSRLFELSNKPGIPIESVEMHIEHLMFIYKNCISILENSEVILNDSQLDHIKDFQPFRLIGSKPDDCSYQCGG